MKVGGLDPRLEPFVRLAETGRWRSKAAVETMAAGMTSSRSQPEPFGVIDTLSDYLSLVDKIWMQWTERQDYIADIWFRGHSDSTWPLLPSALRPPFSDVSEHRYRHEFFLRSRPFLAEATTNPADDWDWYFLMQHYGVPTRLLDWTESSLVALYFAAQPSTPESTGSVWVLCPRVINDRLTKIGNFVPIYTDKSVAPYLPRLWDERPKVVPAAPISIDPLHNSPRIAAQKGKFTVHGRSTLPLEKCSQLSGFLLRINVTSEAKGRLRRQLFSAGITESVLFPGLTGLSRELRDLYAIPWDL